MLILQNGGLFVPIRGIGLQWEFFCIRKKSSSRDLSAAVRGRARDSNKVSRAGEKGGHYKMHITLSGGLIVALGGALPALAIGLIGAKAMEALGRNPEAAARILPVMLLGMAFAEAIAIYALVLAFIGL